jgi:amino acid adenylation domain-containing protein
VDAARAAGLASSSPLEPVPPGQDLPLSFSQERLWVLDRLELGGTAYIMPGVVALKGRLDVPALAAALAEVVGRHEALRTTFPAVQGRPVQRIEEPQAPGDATLLPLVDLAALPSGPRRTERRRLEAGEAIRPFDLAAGPVLRCLLLRLDGGAHRLLAVVHHIAADGWSLEVFLREWTEVYAAAVEGRPARLPRLPLRYGDYAVHQRRHLTEPELAARLALWQERLAGAPTLLELPVDRPRSAPGSGRGGAMPVAVPPAQAERLAALARGEVATLFMALLAVFDVLLWRLADQDCLLVGSPVAGRDRMELEGLIGLFVETRVHRADLRGVQTFRTLLAETRAAVLADQDRPAVPFGPLVEALAPREGRGRRPLVQVMLAFRAAAPEPLRLPGLEATVVPLDAGAAKLDLTLDLARRADGALTGVLEHDRDLFDPATTARFAGHFGVLLAGVLAAPEREIGSLELLTPAERQQLLEWSAGPAGPAGGAGSLAEILARGASAAPAVVAPDGAEISYGELGRRVERLAGRLRRHGVGPEVVVAVLADRSIEQVVGLLAILRVGGVYLPLDPALPDPRLAFLLEDSRAAVVLAPAAVAGTMQPGQTAVLALGEDPGDPAEPPAVLTRPTPPTPLIDDDHLAYLIYTSGSTGVPKAVGVPRRALAEHLRTVVAALGLRPSDRVLQLGSPVFDVALEQTLGAFAAGAALVLRGPDLWTPRELAGRSAALGLTVIDLPASYWAQWVREHGDAPLPRGLALRLVLAGGEAMAPDALRRWLRSPLAGIELVNAYGPTEAVITATLWKSSRPARQPHLETAPIGRPPIGCPLAGRSAVVLGGPPGFAPRPCGAPGELWLGGLLARGYLGRPDLTAERFVPDTWSGEPGARLYRTGDLARFRVDAQLEHLGRIDHQVKVRGFRIEPGEIEAALRSLPGVREAAVVRPEGGERLLAYYVADAGASPDPAALRAALRARLPEFLVPAACLELPELPRTPAGKVDRRALAASVPPPARSPSPASEAPTTPVEAALAAIWSQVLEIDAIGIHDDFFDLGGNSLQATQVLLRIAETFGVDLPVRGFFDHPTLAAQALALAEHLSAGLEGDQLAGLLAEIG